MTQHSTEIAAKHVAVDLFAALSGGARSAWMRWGRALKGLEDEMVKYGSSFGDHVQQSSESGFPGNAGIAAAVTRIIQSRDRETGDMLRAVEQFRAAERHLYETYKTVTGGKYPPTSARGPRSRAYR